MCQQDTQYKRPIYEEGHVYLSLASCLWPLSARCPQIPLDSVMFRVATAGCVNEPILMPWPNRWHPGSETISIGVGTLGEAVQRLP